MAQIYGKESIYLFKQGMVSVAASSTYLLIGLLAIFFVIKVNNSGIHTIDALAFVIFLWGSLFVLIFRRYKKESISSMEFLRGMQGENIVRNELKRLPNPYSIFCDATMPNNRGNIDFIVAGPSGIYTVEVKSHKGVVGFDGKQLLRNGKYFEKDFLSQAKLQALSIHKFLLNDAKVDLYVQPVVVFSNSAKLNFGTKAVNNVLVIQKTWLAEYLVKQPEKMTPKLTIAVEALKKLVVQNENT